MNIFVFHRDKEKSDIYRKQTDKQPTYQLTFNMCFTFSFRGKSKPFPEGNHVSEVKISVVFLES